MVSGLGDARKTRGAENAEAPRRDGGFAAEEGKTVLDLVLTRSGTNVNAMTISIRRNVRTLP